MNKLLVLYGSSEGQTTKIALHIARIIREKGYLVDVIEGRGMPAHFSLEPYRAVIIGASLHAGSYQKYVRTFVQQHHRELTQMPTAFFSVSLTEAYPRPAEKVELGRLMATFLQETGWHPQSVVSFAGALTYSKYGFLKRFIMRRIARQAGAPTDPSHDYEFTDWQAVTRFAESFVTALDPIQEIHTSPV